MQFSKWVDMASCSRQGSVLCPLSLVTKIHDIPETARTFVISLFADDTGNNTTMMTAK